MADAGEAALEEAIGKLFDPETARQYLLQPSRDDVFVVIAFNDKIRNIFIAKGPQEAAALPAKIRPLTPGGGTDFYSCAARAIDVMRTRPEWADHLSAIILMTDGQGQGDADAFAARYNALKIDLPIYGITFGEAERRQLDWLATLSRARVFDGHSDLAGAFRSARGYNRRPRMPPLS